ncbi:hypothetical protein C8R43DRAFT_951824 [Mycena crocata]|nr:hypothetical protein C8R43DRAFT_951824 [Mycena crocata]
MALLLIWKLDDQIEVCWTLRRIAVMILLLDERSPIEVYLSSAVTCNQVEQAWILDGRLAQDRCRLFGLTPWNRGTLLYRSVMVIHEEFMPNHCSNFWITAMAYASGPVSSLGDEGTSSNLTVITVKQNISDCAQVMEQTYQLLYVIVSLYIKSETGPDMAHVGPSQKIHRVIPLHPM